MLLKIFEKKFHYLMVDVLSTEEQKRYTV